MPLFGSSYSGPKEVHYLFVDGASLFGMLKNVSAKYYDGKSFDINFERLTTGFTKVFYYDAIPVREPGETEETYETRIAPKRAIFDAAASVDGIHVYEGDARRRARRGLEQKKVDVMLTVDMLTHAFHRNMHRATLLTGDGDFKPLVDALVQLGMFVTLWFPPNETSAELMRAADARRPITLAELDSLLTPMSRLDFHLPVEQPLHQPYTSGQLLAQIQHKDGRWCELHTASDSFVFIIEEHANYRRAYQHHNYALLRQYCREAVDILLPEEPPSAQT
jgi:uncharacterized LabA/DUF88 family protein